MTYNLYQALQKAIEFLRKERDEAQKNYLEAQEYYKDISDEETELLILKAIHETYKKVLEKLECLI